MDNEKLGSILPDTLHLKRKNLVIFDLDDTLIHTRMLYNIAYMNAGKALIDAVGTYAPLGSDMIKRVETINAKLQSVMNYSAERFPLSWVLLYREICSEYNLPVYEEAVESIRYEASSFQRGPFEVIDGVNNVVSTLDQRPDVDMMILTAGDFPLQRKKVNEAQLSTYFTEGVNFMIADSTKDAILDALVKRNKDNHPLVGKVIMVGDSLYSDIRPAKKAGAMTIRIPTPGHWAHDDAEVEPDYTISDMTKLLSVLEHIIPTPNEESCVQK